ncbi:TadE/TadG family type IV pilus assembly protein [Nocardia sp. N13]|uniref:TadE/TadG family type IV pilus assembly protein n=1 Tax=Nocardioides sp. N13(2025) TaxID=3453405 RepID=UPI003F760EBA
MRELMRRRGRNERGAAAVEFALVVPVLLVIVIGIFNFGFVLAQQISLNNGARQAARYAVVDGPTCADVVTEARNGAETIGMSASQVPTPTVTPCSSSTAKPCAGAAVGTNITVTMVRSAPWTVTLFPFNLIPTPTLTGKGVMRCEFK